MKIRRRYQLSSIEFFSLPLPPALCPYLEIKVCIWSGFLVASSRPFQACRVILHRPILEALWLTALNKYEKFLGSSAYPCPMPNFTLSL